MNRDLRGFPGTKRYAPRRLLGAGGMGAVYEVDDHTTGGRVALKMMLDDDAGRLLRFKQEFRVMAELHHPNLVRLFDLEQHEGRWFFTMELVNGQDLIEVLLSEDAGDGSGESAPETMSSTVLARAAVPDRAARGPGEEAPAPRLRRIACDPDALIRIVAQILDALEFLHRHGIVHRDLKPSNILVDLEGTVRVLDFGLASRLDRPAAISQDGAVVGTLAYLSPEQYRGGPASAASDLYALGVMMFQLLTGELPFQGAPMVALVARTEGPPPRADEWVRDAPLALCEIIHRLMAVDPALRPSIAEVRAALELGRHASLRAPARAVTEEIFVGRDQELAMLDGCLERAAGGQGQIALVSGPSGIGKTALATMMRRRAERLGFLCFGGRCYEREQVPFVAFDRVMDAMTLALRRWPPARLAALRPSLLLLQRIFPALGVLTGVRRSEASAQHPLELHRQALDAFRELCSQCQAEAPLCFVLDDLQWADEESITLLSDVLVGGPGRIMVLGLLRPDGIDADHPLDGLLRQIHDSEAAVSLSLATLGATDARHLVAAVTEGRIDPGMSDALAAQAAGNPFLLLRLCEHLATLEPGEQTARLDTAGSADELLRRMIATLSPRAEQVLALAATAGGDIAAPLLRAASGLRNEDFAMAVGELSAARFFRTVRAGLAVEASGDVARGEPRFDLYHDRIREVAYQGLSAERRSALHRSLAMAIEAQPEGRARDAEGLVRHWGEAGDRDRQRRYAIEAAEQAAEKLAFVRAARLFRIVLDDPQPGEDPLVTAARWQRAGDLFECGGQHLVAARAYQEALRRWNEAPATHPDRRAAQLRLRGRAGAGLMARGLIVEARAVFEGGLALLGLPLDRPVPVRLLILAGLRVRSALTSRRSAQGREDAAVRAAAVYFFDFMVRGFAMVWPWIGGEAAMRRDLLGRRIADTAVLQRSLAYGAAIPVTLGRCSPAQIARSHKQLDEAEALARAHELPLGLEIVRTNRAAVWLATNLARARDTAEAAVAGFTRRGLADSFDGIIAADTYLMILYFQGDDDRGLATLERYLDSSRAGDTGMSLVRASITRRIQAGILARRGQPGEARAALEPLRTLLADVPPSRLHFGLANADRAVLVAEGRFAEALSSVARDEQLAKQSGAWVIGFDRSLHVYVLLEASIGLLRRSALPARGRRSARRWAAWLARHGVVDLGCLGHRALAFLEHTEGRPAKARRAIVRALALSSTNTGAHSRWLCLEAARDLGVLTLDQEEEAAALAKAGHFGLPAGWGHLATAPARKVITTS